MELRIDYAWNRPICETLALEDKWGYYQVYFDNEYVDPKAKKRLNLYLFYESQFQSYN